jgi:hypothetical protein
MRSVGWYRLLMQPLLGRRRSRIGKVRVELDHTFVGRRWIARRSNAPIDAPASVVWHLWSRARASVKASSSRATATGLGGYCAEAPVFNRSASNTPRQRMQRDAVRWSHAALRRSHLRHAQALWLDVGGDCALHRPPNTVSTQLVVAGVHPYKKDQIMGRHEPALRACAAATADRGDSTSWRCSSRRGPMSPGCVPLVLASKLIVREKKSVQNPYSGNTEAV